MAAVTPAHRAPTASSLRRVVILSCLVIADGAHAAPPVARLTLSRCGAVVDEWELQALLRIELGGDATLATGAAGAPLDNGATLDVRCAADASELTLSVGDRSDRLSLAEVPPRMRARTLALALAEGWRRARQDAVSAPTVLPAEKLAEKPVEVTAPATAPSLPAFVGPPPPRRAPFNFQRLFGGLAGGSFAFSLAAFAIGAPLPAIEPSNPDRRDLHLTGVALLGVATTALISSVVTLGLWSRERRRSR